MLTNRGWALQLMKGVTVQTSYNHMGKPEETLLTIILQLSSVVTSSPAEAHPVRDWGKHG